ncbi:MAG: prepilin-type N-terminal cleavage/methylation domain-containing protein [Patescibacteria group bacterium]
MNKLARARIGYTLIEILIVIAIVAILAVVTFVILSPAIKTARDARRKAEISQIGRFLVLRCYVPDAGEGDYDLVPLVAELKEKYPQFANLVSQTPRDPSKGSTSESFYRYIVNGTAKKCSIYANLEDRSEPVTLSNISVPTAGGGTGVWQGEAGWNNSDKYFQFSN